MCMNHKCIILQVTQFNVLPMTYNQQDVGFQLHSSHLLITLEYITCSLFNFQSVNAQGHHSHRDCLHWLPCFPSLIGLMVCLTHPEDPLAPDRECDQMFLQQGFFSSVFSALEVFRETGLIGLRTTSLLLTLLWISVVGNGLLSMYIMLP